METSQAEGGTRSGLLWEFERIISECKELGYDHLPQILVMENVPQIHSEKDMPSFRKWILRLEELGYTNYWEDLNAKDYGIPQNRERTIMVSILRDKDGNEYNYKFPKPFKRELVLKDMLEDNVDEKYYLSQRMIQYLQGVNQKPSKYNRQKLYERSVEQKDRECAYSITTNAGNRATDNYLFENTDLREITNLFENGCKGVNRRTGAVYDAKGVSPTLLARNQGDNGFIAVDTNNKALNETLKNNEVKDGDFIDAYNRKVKSDVAGTITTRVDASNDTFVAEEPQVIGGIGEKKSNGGTQWYEQNRIYDDKLATALPAQAAFHPYYATNLRIRKLTPKEAGRLMAFQDIDTDNMYAIGLTNSSLYHVYGDSICVNVLIAVFSKFFNCNAEQLVRDYIKTIKN